MKAGVGKVAGIAALVIGGGLLLMPKKAKAKTADEPDGAADELDSDADDQPAREPYTSPVWVPTTDKELILVRFALCGCSAEEPSEPLTCVWTSLWPQVPYPPIEGDHESVAQAYAVLSE